MLFPLLATWLREVGESASDALAFVPVALALITLAVIVRGWYHGTLGRRRDRYARLGRLGTNAQLSFFTSVLGEPPAIKRRRDAKVRRYVTRDEYEKAADWEIEPSEGDGLDDEEEDYEYGEDPENKGYVWALVPTAYTECFFIDRDYYVQALCDEDETVIGFSVTTRTSRFRPTFTGHESLGRRGRKLFRKITGQPWSDFFHLRLGRTRFVDLGIDREWSPSYQVIVGARWAAYSEAYYFGNPGYYQTFVFSAGGAAYHSPVGPLGELSEAVGTAEWFGGLLDEDAPRSPHAPDFEQILERVRRESVVTTYTVVGPHIQLSDYPATFGPHGDEVRTLP
jgi:hypothetical protein